MTDSRRHDRLGVHSIGEFHMTVPSLADAERFYGAFGLTVKREGGGLTLRAAGNEHVWGRLSEGPRKQFDRLTFHCFEEDFAKLVTHAEASGAQRVAAPAGADASGVWLQDPDGLLVQVRPGPKTTLNAAQREHVPLPVDGTRCAPYRSLAKPRGPQRLSHIALMTPGTLARSMTSPFCTRTLVSERSISDGGATMSFSPARMMPEAGHGARKARS